MVVGERWDDDNHTLSTLYSIWRRIITELRFCSELFSISFDLFLTIWRSISRIIATMKNWWYNLKLQWGWPNHQSNRMNQSFNQSREWINHQSINHQSIEWINHQSISTSKALAGMKIRAIRTFLTFWESVNRCLVRSCAMIPNRTKKWSWVR